MDFDKLTLELDKINFNGENELNDPETWLFNPTPTEGKEAIKEEEENLEKWLKGAVDKVDFRTRTALCRKLEKKRRVKEKEKRRNNVESSLSMIEEVSGESGPLSDREQQRRPPGEKENMAKRKCISEASIDSNDEDEEEDEYFDAPSTPKKLPLIGRNPVAQQSPRKIRNGGGGQTQTLSRNSAFTSQRSSSRNMQKALSIEGPEMAKELRNLSDIERRAREQEQELQTELMNNRRDRLSANHQQGSIRSRPDSASSSSTSSIHNGVTNANNSNPPNNHLSTSKSVDFRSHHHHPNSDHQSSMTSSHSNEGSLADLSSASTSDPFCIQPLNSRLPLPRRPTIPGKTGIPLPAPSKRVPNKMIHTSPPADPTPMNDDECF